ncbi:MAG TPA: class I SAM-dependent methyltransferase [Opitutaceae bacterium]|jgi:SAM-dependent methyltransferase
MLTERAGRPDAPLACRCCGSPALTLRGSRHSRFLHRDFSFWHCSACDYLFVEPFSGYGIYDDVYYRGEGPDPFVDYESEYRDYRKTDRVLEFDDLARQATRYAARAIPEGPIEWLDFGCGAGGLLKYLSDRKELCSGTRRWPVRISGSDVGVYADRLRRDDGLRIVGLGELAAEPDARYAVISLIEVVEHIEYPDPVFALVARLLKPGGLLLVTTGNISSFIATSKGLDYGYVMPEVHVGYFTPTALERIYARHGLIPLRLRYDGVVRFKVIKTLRTAGRQRIARVALRLPGVVRAIDALFGTSKMPCAAKPR